MTAAVTVDDLFAVLERSHGVWDAPDGLGDPVDILDHSLQCANVLAAYAPDDPELQVAGLVHDLGHVVTPEHWAEHGETGAAYVRELLGRRVARLTELHVPAKRYLVMTDATYAASLSDGSALSLEVQGGGLSEAELAELAADPGSGRRADAAPGRRGREGHRGRGSGPGSVAARRRAGRREPPALTGVGNRPAPELGAERAAA